MDGEPDADSETDGVNVTVGSGVAVNEIRELVDTVGDPVFVRVLVIRGEKVGLFDITGVTDELVLTVLVLVSLELTVEDARDEVVLLDDLDPVFVTEPVDVELLLDVLL